MTMVPSFAYYGTFFCLGKRAGSLEREKQEGNW